MLLLIMLLMAGTTGAYLAWQAYRGQGQTEKVQYVLELICILSIIASCVLWYNFEFALAVVVLLSGLIYFFDVVWWSKKRKVVAGASHSAQSNVSLWVCYSREFFVVLFVVLLIRGCAFSPYKIPSGSLEPTLLVGDYILVNKFAYGLRLPVSNQVLVPVGQPKRGDIVVVRWPANEKLDFIKRVVGVPGDHLRYVDKKLYINGQLAKQTLQQTLDYALRSGTVVTALRQQENLLGVHHEIYQFKERLPVDYLDIVVPKDHYFLMGDNRDDSEDSRYWGFVSSQQLVGRAEYVIVSWDRVTHRMRWSRTADAIT